MLNFESNNMQYGTMEDFESENMFFYESQFVEQPSQQVEEKPYQDFFLYCDLNNEIKNDSLFVAEDSSTKDKLSGSIMGDSKSDTNETEKSFMMVPFVGETPDMSEFEKLIQLDMNSRGANQMVCDALEIKEEDDLYNVKPQLIKVKKRKSKEQLKALADEFAKNNDWSKEFMNEFAAKIKLDAAQVYKWHWDQICKKLGKNPKKQEKARKKKLNQDASKKRRRSSNSKTAKKSQKTSE